jgi:phosphoglycolate phosphatase-like HAD superfamily hydrolase
VDTPNRPPAIICDVDGTLCDVRAIRHHVERPETAQRFRANYSLFHSLSEDCPAFPSVLHLVIELERAGYAIVVVTAREARWAELTERWLDRQLVPRVELITRGALDYRSDALVKAEICAEILNRYSPRLAIDDRDDILAVWAAASIPTVKVDQAGCLSPITWPGVVGDDRLSALVKRVCRDSKAVLND